MWADCFEAKEFTLSEDEDSLSEDEKPQCNSYSLNLPQCKFS